MADAELPNFLKNISLLDIRQQKIKNLSIIRGEKNSQIGKTFLSGPVAISFLY